MTKIALDIKDCRGCPHMRSERTEGAGYALDFHCRLTGNLICGYVEYESEVKPVPDDCPIRIVEEES